MILIADSGSTKTIWYWTNNIKTHVFNTQGLNPYLVSAQEIEACIRQNLLPPMNTLSNEVEAIYFYGAGCASETNQQLLGTALSNCFPKCSNVLVRSDIWASIYATCGQQKGICAILGTGTNSCVFDGVGITDQLASLGYMLGDEGSGCQIGKRLLQAYFYREMPTELTALFYQKYNLEEHQFVTKLFAEIRPNEYLASFTDFAVENKEQPFVQQLLIDSFREFIERHVLKYKEAKKWPVHFMGSVAFGFREILIKLLSEYGLKEGNILKTPFPQLLDFHQQNRIYSI